MSFDLIGDEGGELGEVVEVLGLDPLSGLCVAHDALNKVQTMYLRPY